MRAGSLPAGPAKSVDLQPVAGRDESMVGGDTGEPAVEPALCDLDDPVAPRADQMVVVLVAAASVADLTGVVAERVYETGFRKRLQSPVDGRESETFTALP